MMGRQTVDQGQLFYLFNLERRIPERHLLRRINPTVTRILAEFRDQLEPFYSEIGRPSIDPELNRVIVVEDMHCSYCPRSICSFVSSARALSIWSTNGSTLKTLRPQAERVQDLLCPYWDCCRASCHGGFPPPLPRFMAQSALPRRP